MSEKKLRTQSILIVDDEQGIRSMLEERFSKMGYRVEVAANGMHALQKLNSGKEIDVIVCDMKMPGMTGLELLRQVRVHEKYKATSFVFMTGYPEKQSIIETAKLGIIDYFIKPFDNGMLAARIEDFFKQKKVLDEGEPDEDKIAA